VLAGSNTIIAYDLDATSDHRPLLSTVPWDQRYLEPTSRIRFDTIDQPLFLSQLASNLEGLAELVLTEEGLDSTANNLVSALHSAYQGTAKRSLGLCTGQPWWNTDCS